MKPEASLTRAALKTPKAAAVAGIVFAVLLLAIFALFRNAVPGDPMESGAWLTTDRSNVAVALNLVPFCGIAFLWFIGALRHRLGAQEDQFFATVYFGSGVLFLALLFVSATIIGAVLLILSGAPADATTSATFHFARASAYIVINVYAIKMACVFMIATSTVVISTAIAPRWIAILGYVLAVAIFVGSYYASASFILMPIWVLVLSVYMVIETYRSPGAAAP